MLMRALRTKPGMYPRGVDEDEVGSLHSELWDPQIYRSQVEQAEPNIMTSAHEAV